MALDVTYIKKTNGEAVIKVAGTDDTVTVALADLVGAREELDGQGTPTVNIVSATWSGGSSSTVNVARNGVDVLTADSSVSNELNLYPLGYVDTTENESDLDFTITGTAQIFLKLRKVEGYLKTFEPETYGAYDDETLYGPLDIVGAPPPYGLFDLPSPGSGSYDTGGALTMTSVGTPYTPGDSVSSINNETLGLYRKKFAGNFGTSAGSGIDTEFCRTHTGFFGKPDTYVSFGSQDLASENFYTFEWVGYFKAPTTATYNFWCTTDDDTYFWIGTNALYDNNSSSNHHMYKSNVNRGKNTNSVTLTAGQYYPVRIQFGEYSGAEKCQILWGRTTDTEAVAGNDGTSGTQVWYHNSVTKGH